jgi:hypothetical protein
MTWFAGRMTWFAGRIPCFFGKINHFAEEIRHFTRGVPHSAARTRHFERRIPHSARKTNHFTRGTPHFAGGRGLFPSLPAAPRQGSRPARLLPVPCRRWGAGGGDCYPSRPSPLPPHRPPRCPCGGFPLLTRRKNSRPDKGLWGWRGNRRGSARSPCEFTRQDPKETDQGLSFSE